MQLFLSFATLSVWTCSGLQVLRELRNETAVAYPERRNNQIAPEQARQTRSSPCVRKVRACRLANESLPVCLTKAQ